MGQLNKNKIYSFMSCIPNCSRVFFDKIVNFFSINKQFNLYSNLINRIRSSIILFSVFAISLINDTLLSILFIASGVIMLLEWDRAFNKNSRFMNINLSLFFIINISIYFLSLVSIFLLKSYTIATIILMFGFIFSMFILIYFNRDKFILEALPSIYISGAIVSTLYLYNRFGIIVLALLFVITISTDTCAYFFGSYFQGSKLAPKISPNKTISGAVSGVIGAFVFSCLYIIFLFLFGFIYSISDLHLYGLLAIVMSVLAQCGDLFESYCKRICSVKDFGNLISGHGGVLDRFDSFIAIVPICAIIEALAVL